MVIQATPYIHILTQFKLHVPAKYTLVPGEEI